MFPTEVPAPNPEVLAWARDVGGFDLARVAKRLSVKERRIEEWESGDGVPTIRQLTNLAHLYHRPFSMFYQATMPTERPITAEYRRLPEIQPGAESADFRLAIRHMLFRRDVTLDLMEELGYDWSEFTLTASLGDDPAQVGAALRQAIGITVEEQRSWKSSWQAWREWRRAIEEAGVLVSMFPKVALEEARGVALLRRPLPVVAVNTKEDAESRAFTALHEMVHLMLARAHEERSADEDRRSNEEILRAERFADEAAGNALLPRQALADDLRGGFVVDVESIRQLALRYRVTPLAMATRLWRSELISGGQYNDWRSAWQNVIDGLPKKKGGFATPVSKALGRGGRSYCQLVIEALDSGRITIADATKWLNLRSSQLETLRTKLVAGTSGGGADE